MSINRGKSSTASKEVTTIYSYYSIKQDGTQNAIAKEQTSNEVTLAQSSDKYQRLETNLFDSYKYPIRTLDNLIFAAQFVRKGDGQVLS